VLLSELGKPNNVLLRGSATVKLYIH